MPETIFDNLEDALFEFIFYDRLNLIRLSKPRRAENEDEEVSLFPNHKGIIVKTVFVIDENSGRKFPNKSYYDYDPGTFSPMQEKVDKKQISAVLKSFLLDYIKKNKSLNDYFVLMEKSVTKKSKAVKYELKFSDYVSFNIVIEPNDLEVEDVSEFITGLPIENLKEEKISGSGSSSSDSWKVEIAKSSRAACRTCSQKIMKDEIRIGEPSYFQEHLSYKWHHLNCIRNFNENNSLTGLNDLSSEQQESIKNKLFAKQPSLTHETEKESSTKSAKVSKTPRDIIINIINEFVDSEGLTSEFDIFKKGKENKLEDADIKSLLFEMEEEGQLYRPAPGKVKMI